MAAIPSTIVSDPYQASVSERVYSHKVAMPPIRSEWKLFKPQGNFTSGQNQVTFNVFPPSNTTIVDKRMLVRLGIQVTTNPGSNNNEAAPMGALRAFPVNNAIAQSNIVINGAGGFVTQSDEVAYVLKRFIKVDETAFYHTPTQTDSVADYVHTYGIFAEHNLLGDPFCGWAEDGYITEAVMGSSQDGKYVPRGMFPSVTEDTTTYYQCCEVLLNGVLGNASQEEGFVNVSKLDITLTFATSLLNALWSSFQGLNLDFDTALRSADNSPTVEITSCELLCHFITPSITSVPSVFTTDFKQYILNTQGNSQVIPIANSRLDLNQSAQLTFNNLTLNTVPEFLYIYVRPPRPLATTTGEVAARIRKISINLGTSFGHLSQLDENTLYLMSMNNGYKGRGFIDWINTGSFLCIDCAKDLGLVPGQNRYLPIDFTIDCAFPYRMPDGDLVSGYSAGTCTVNLLAVVPGAVSIEPDRCTSILGFSSIEQANAMADNEITETSLVKDMGTQGAGMGAHGGKLTWGGVWRAIKTGVKKAAPIAQAVAGMTGNPYANMAAEGLATASNLIGNGYGRKRGRGMLLG